MLNTCLGWTPILSNKFSKDLILVPNKPWHSRDVLLWQRISFNYSLLRYYIQDDFDTWILPYTRGAMVTGDLVLSLQVQVALKISIFKSNILPFRMLYFLCLTLFELFVWAKYLGLNCNSPWFTTINSYCKVRLPYF